MEIFTLWRHEEKWMAVSHTHFPDYCKVTIKCCRDCNEKLNKAEADQLLFVRKKSYTLKKLGTKGSGLFSAFSVEKGETKLIKYGGETISKHEADDSKYSVR